MRDRLMLRRILEACKACGCDLRCRSSPGSPPGRGGGKDSSNGILCETHSFISLTLYLSKVPPPFSQRSDREGLLPGRPQSDPLPVCRAQFEVSNPLGKGPPLNSSPQMSPAVTGEGGGLEGTSGGGGLEFLGGGGEASEGGGGAAGPGGGGGGVAWASVLRFEARGNVSAVEAVRLDMSSSSRRPTPTDTAPPAAGSGMPACASTQTCMSVVTA